MNPEEFAQHIKETSEKFDFSHVGNVNSCDYIPQLCQVSDHKPFFDDDGDMFSNYESLRGSNWRGKDCDDNSNSVFPGRYDPDVANDNNCNGIFGVDPNTNVPYEN